MLESAPKVTESILSDCILRGMGSNPAAVRVFAWASPRHPAGLHFAMLLFKSFAWAKHCFLWLPKVT